MLHDHDAALMLLKWRNRASELLDVASDDTDSWKETRRTKILADSCPPLGHLRSLQQRLITKSLKLQILVPESRTIFGVSEPP